MATVFIDEARLTAIGEAIRGKTGETALLKVADMPAAIEGITTGSGGGALPEEAYKIYGSITSKFQSNEWNWYITLDGVYTEGLTASNSAFYYCSSLTKIPFDFNFLHTQAGMGAFASMFSYCSALESIGAFRGTISPSNCTAMFSECYKLRYLPEGFDSIDWSYMQTSTNRVNQMYYNCCSLREIPENVLKGAYSASTNANYNIYNKQFYRCFCLNEIRGLTANADNYITSNMFIDTFYKCTMLKEVIFDTQDDGSPYVRDEWHNQTITLGVSSSVPSDSWCAGVANSGAAPVFYNTTDFPNRDKEVTDDATYQALKNDPDWWTMDIAYSRYNHDSAVNTLNSLPEVASSGTKNNTIKFLGAAGSKTDGGAIENLTASEIAVATAKYWTVSIT